MLKELGRRLAAGLVAAVLIAVAAGATLVALAFATYAGLKMVVAPAAAAAVTALVFAAVAALIVTLAPHAIAGGAQDRSQPAARKPRDPAAMRIAGEAAMAIVRVAADLALSQRLRLRRQARKPERPTRR